MPVDAQPLKVLLILSALMAFASISTDIYLPALPAIGISLGVPADKVAYTLSAFLVGFSLGQLIWGPLSDRRGRRMPAMVGVGLFVVGSIGCAIAGSLEQLMVWRVLQALGACAGPVLGRAMVRDLYGREQAARMMSTLMLIMGIAPLIGPILGGQLLVLGSWRPIFWFLVLLGVLVLAALRKLPETLADENRVREPIGQTLRVYAGLAINPKLLSYGLSGGFFYGAIYAYLAGTPFAYIAYYHVSPQMYGLLFAVNIVGMMAANFANVKLVMRLGSERIFRLGTWVVFVSSLVLAICAKTDLGGLAGLAIPVFFFVSMNGLIVANSVAGALAAFPQRAGAASSIIGVMQYGSGVLTAAMIGWFADGTPWTMGWIIGLCGVGCVIMGVGVNTGAGRHRRRKTVAR